MSKHKHFHSTRDLRKALQHGHKERIGPMSRPVIQRKETIVSSNSQASGNLTDRKERHDEQHPAGPACPW